MDPNGTFQGAFAMYSDITDRKTAEDEIARRNKELHAAYEHLTVTEEELRQNYDELTKSQDLIKESERKYRNVVEDQTEFISRFLPDGTHIFVNEAYCRYFGLKREEIIGHRFRPRIPVEDRDQVKKFFMSLTRDHPIDTIENRIIMPDGALRWQWWSDRAIFDSFGTVTEYQAVGRDITEEKITEITLQESEQRNAAMIAALPDLLFVLDRDGTYLDFQASDENLLAVSPDQILGKTIIDIGFDADTTKTILLAISTAIETGIPQKIEYKLTVPTGNSWFEARLVRLGVDRVLGIVRDITERKNAELVLVESEKKYRLLLEGLYDSILVHRDTKILYLNPACEKVLGYSRDALLGQSIMILVPPEFREMVAGAARKRMAGETFEPYELDLIRGDDSRISVIMSGNLGEFEGAPASINLIIDISSRKRAGQALQESEKRLYSIYNTVEDVIFQLKVESNEQYRFTSVNQAFNRVTGLPAEQVIGRNVNEIIPEPSLTTVLEKYRQAIKEKAIVHWEEISNYPTGQLTGDVSVAPIFDETGNCSHLIGSVHDITECKRAEDALNQANRKLNLLSSITRHDITNQLTTLQGYLAILEMNRNDPNFKEYLQKAKTTAERISASIKFTKECESIGVNAPVWQDCRTLIETAAKQVSLANIRLRNDIPAGTEVFADPLVQKVFYNLIDNAIRYGGPKMTMNRISSHESDKGLIISVEDDGMGISADDKKRLFERGFGHNTGLGLFLSSEILSITGITIHETGEPSKGARFEMTIPKGAYRFSNPVKE
jgi:PAS domain S-box-containing protein